MNFYGQRNLKPDDLVGFGTEPFSKVGCTVVSLCNLFVLNGYDRTPQSVNTSLKDAKAFDGSYIIWEKIKDAFDFVEGALRVRTYDNVAVLEAIMKYGGCLVEVSAAPIGGTGKHWVLFMGDHKAYDPWNNKETPTSNWQPSGYAVIQIKKKAVEPVVEAPSNKELSDQLSSIQKSVDILYQDRDINTDISAKVVALTDEFQNFKKFTETRFKSIDEELAKLPQKIDQSVQNSMETMTDKVGKADNVTIITPESMSLLEKIWRSLFKR